MATIATTPLWVYVLSRPRVDFDLIPAGFWSFAPDQANQSTMLIFLVNIALVNLGNEESGIGGVALKVDEFRGLQHWVPECIASSQLIGDRIASNGGRREAQLVFSMVEPEAKRLVPHAEPLPYFISGRHATGRIEVLPIGNKRLLWGKKRVRKDVYFVSNSWSALQARFIPDNFELLASQLGIGSKEP